jgi:hypothetical protein
MAPLYSESTAVARVMRPAAKDAKVEVVGGLGGQFLSQIEADLGGGVAAADHQHGATGERSRVAILDTVQDAAAEVLAAADRRHRRHAVDGGGDRDLAGQERPGTGLDLPEAVGCRAAALHPRHLGGEAQVRAETVQRRVAAKVVEQLIARQERVVIAPQPTVVRHVVVGRVQVQAIVGGGPEVADLVALLEDGEVVDAGGAQRRADPEAAEAGTDDGDIEARCHRRCGRVTGMDPLPSWADP